MRPSCFGTKHVVLFSATVSFERECRILKQGRGTESELHVCANNTFFNFFFIDGELDVFVIDQQSTWLVGVVAKPLQTEFAVPWEEFGSEIGQWHFVVREPRHWLCKSLERHCRKPF